MLTSTVAGVDLEFKCSSCRLWGRRRSLPRLPALPPSSLTRQTTIHHPTYTLTPHTNRTAALLNEHPTLSQHQIAEHQRDLIQSNKSHPDTHTQLWSARPRSVPFLTRPCTDPIPIPLPLGTTSRLFPCRISGFSSTPSLLPSVSYTPTRRSRNPQRK